MRRPTFLEKNQSLLRHRPLIVGTIAGPHSITDQIKEARRANPDLIEIRQDTLPLRAFQDIRRVLKKPILLTIRSAHENGGKEPYHALKEADRLTLFKFLLPLCDMIDVELRHPELMRELGPIARSFRVNVMHSAHDFKRVGTPGRLGRWATMSRRFRGDVLKMAVMPRTDTELENFMNWGMALGHPCPVLIGMGAVGLPSRYLGFSYGSRLTYGHLGHSAAPGQPSAADLKKRICEVYW
jgi:3-dehydroquinate dehydratase type I